MQDLYLFCVRLLASPTVAMTLYHSTNHVAGIMESNSKAVNMNHKAADNSFPFTQVYANHHVMFTAYSAAALSGFF